ncbi:hypothetical protein [Alloyangia pacifica]|uniref:Sulfotransferase family protein n=1 Tax=Alloyangia pacifica TaxID=311180 RepID=A0A1I6T3U3_9RHOB|nr:hypothetical protein [Alloyangia pacifica]SDG96921.1 hypothetical protein SAMN04488245_105284 [Alloyangia pacifica]SFS83944.1 hypothetical protein SAMN04488050_105284 [Alloyangia pacifica]
MRFLPESNFLFVHIPKNGGQSVRNAMSHAGELSFAPLAEDLGISEDEAARTSESGYEHPVLGPIHPAHLPLWVMRDHFPACWKVLQASQSLALTRAPRERFISALMQRLREFGGAGAIRAEDDLVIHEATRVKEWLSEHPRVLGLEYIHFTPQVDFVNVDGVRQIDAIFPMSQMASAASWIEAHVGLHLSIGHDHARRQPKPWARALQPAARFAGRKLMPHAVKRRLHPLWMASGVFSNASKGYSAIDFGPEIEGFIAEYYAADADLHREAQANAAEQQTTSAA